MKRPIIRKLPHWPTPDHCPACRAVILCATPLNVETIESSIATNGPEPGAWSFCYNCGRILRFGPELALMLVSESDPAIPSELRTLRDSWLAFHQAKPEGDNKNP